MNQRGSRAKQGASLDSTPSELSDVTLEPGYSARRQHGNIAAFFYQLPENTVWNLFICGLVLVMLVMISMDVLFYHPKEEMYFVFTYDVVYAFHVCCIAVNVVRLWHIEEFTFCMKVAFVLDLLSYTSHVDYFAPKPLLWAMLHEDFCCYLRLHRPFRYIYKMDNDSMKGSLLVTSLKIIYTCLVVRIFCACFWMYWNYFLLTEQFSRESQETKVAEQKYNMSVAMNRRVLSKATRLSRSAYTDENSMARQTFQTLYNVDKMFIPIGPTESPINDGERVIYMVIMMAGCLALTGAAVAWLSAVISVLMRPEEEFRARYRLIIQDMIKSHIPPTIRGKVETFYKMYWHKQRAVSAARLLPAFPPALPRSVHVAIYFEAMHKTRLLRHLSYQFLSEVAQKMETIHFIPGDTIMRRNLRKDAIIYIAYGDIEMLTAEDDLSPILRFTRGTILTPFGACAAGGGRAHVTVRAATFCTAHVLRAAALWRVACRHRGQRQNGLMLAALNRHLRKVKMHYLKKPFQGKAKYKSSIMQFKKTLTELKEARDENGELLLSRSDYFLEIAGCYIMRNRADASLADDADPICLRQTFPCILQPASSLLTAWNWLVALLILIISITYPYYLVFRNEVPLEFYFFDTMMTAVYVIDVIAYLSTGTNVEGGVPITFLQTCSVQARSYWFALDVLATVPVFLFVWGGRFTGINKILRLPKVFQMMKSLEGEYVYDDNVIRLFSYTLLLTLACYLCAALQQAFMCFNYGFCIVNHFNDPPYWTYAPLDDETVSDRVIFGFYWATSMITFTVHLEPWSEQNISTLMYTVVLLEAAIVLHILIEAVYSATIMVSNAIREDYDGCIASVQNFLVRNEVDPLLQHRFITYLKLCWYTDKAYSMTTKQSSVFYDLPPHVYLDILARQRCKYILCIPFMKLLHKEDLKNISSQARMFCTSPGEILLNTGDISNEMYVIRQGSCHILSPDTKSVVGILEAKSHFGVIECLFRLPAFYTVRAITNVQVFSISRKLLSQAVKLPQIKDAMEYAKEQPEFARLQVRRERFVHYKLPPPAPKREKFRLPRKHETDFSYLQPFKRTAFFSVLRYVFPRYTFRPDALFLTRYELFRAGCALATALLFPSYTYMVLQWPWLYFVTLLLDLLAFGDTFFRMLVGYYNESGVLVFHPASTAAHYLKGAYLLDLFSCFPLENMEASNRISHKYSRDYYQVTMVKQILMMNRMLQLYRLPGALGVLEGIVERQDFIIVLKTLPMFLMALNVLTSLLVFCSAKIYNSADGRAWLIEPIDDAGGSWLHVFENEFRFDITSTPWNLHLACYFWIVYESTTTGYNNLRPSNQQIIYVLFISMILGYMFTTYLTVRIISIRANVNKVLAGYQENLKDLVQFMRKEKLPKSLQRELMDYYEYNWDRTGGVDHRHVLKLCDQITLRTDAILHLYGTTFVKCPILSRCDVALLRILGRAVRSVYFLRNTQVLLKNDVVQDLFFVDSGCLNVRATYEDRSTTTTLTIGSIFGNLEDEPAARMPGAVIASTDVHLLQMSSAAFHHIVKDCDFPEVLELMRRHRPDNEMYIQGAALSRHGLRAASLAAVLTRSRRRILNSLHMNNGLIHIYFIIISILCVYTDIYNMGNQNNSTSLITCLYVFDAGFIFKMLLHFFLPRILKVNNIANILTAKLEMKYFKGEFKYDVASLIPIELLSYMIPSKNSLLLFSWLRMNRMLRIITIYSSLKVFRKQLVTSNLILSSFSLLVWFTLFIHASACLWYFIGALECEASPRSCWFYDTYDVLLCNDTYLCSLYFTFTTFSQNGVGDILPKKQSEVVFVAMLQVVSTMVYAVYVGEFINIIQYASFRSFSYYSKFLELQKFMKNNRVSSALVRLVSRYAVHVWRAGRGEQCPRFLVSAPRCLKLKVMAAVYMPNIKQHPVFKDCEPAMLRQLIVYLRHYYYDENMFVVKESEITDAMYLVHAGKVVETSHDNPGSVLRVYNAGEHFGVGLVRNQPFPYSYRTLIKSQVLTLRLDDWEHLLKYFPACYDCIHKFQNFNNNDDNRKDEDVITLLSSPQMYDLGPSDNPPDAPTDAMPHANQTTSSFFTPMISSFSSRSGRHSKGPVTKKNSQDKLRKKSISFGGMTPGPSSEQESTEMTKKVTNLDQDQVSLPDLSKPSSSTILFEKIAREAAIAESILLESVAISDLQDRVIPLDQQSVEDYLRYKYNMRDSNSIDRFDSRKSSAVNVFYDELDETESIQMRDTSVRYKSDTAPKTVTSLSNELQKDVQLHRRLTLSPENLGTHEQKNQYSLDSDVFAQAAADTISSDINEKYSGPLVALADTEPGPSDKRSSLITSKENLTRTQSLKQSLNLLAIEYLESVERSHDAPTATSEEHPEESISLNKDPGSKTPRKEPERIDLLKGRKVSFEELDSNIEIPSTSKETSVPSISKEMYVSTTLKESYVPSSTKIKDEKADIESDSKPSCSKDNEEEKSDDKNQKQQKDDDSEESSLSDSSFYFFTI